VKSERNLNFVGSDSFRHDAIHSNCA